jgi:hypothetical protein
MKRAANGTATSTRALECAITAVAVLLAEDGIRAVVAPFWQITRLLFGI